MTDEPQSGIAVPAADPVAASVVSPAEKPKKTASNNPYVWGTGRRKTAVARVRIKQGNGEFRINGRKVDDFFHLDKDRSAVRTPLNVTDSAKSIDVFVNVNGGGVTGQAGAVVLGLSRALADYNPDLESKLREHNLMRRDPRKVERKKYGQSGARRRFQFSKR